MNFLLLVFKCSNSNRAEYNLRLLLKNNTVLDVNFNYQGRKSNRQAIHTGNLQLRAYF
jgi:hypothetical protein